MRLAAGLRPDPLGELERSPRPSSRNWGEGCLLLRRREGKEGMGMGKGRREEKEREERGEQGRSQDFEFRGLKPMASAEREHITGVWGRAPSGVQGQSPWWGSGGRSPLKLKGF